MIVVWKDCVSSYRLKDILRKKKKKGLNTFSNSQRKERGIVGVENQLCCQAVWRVLLSPKAGTNTVKITATLLAMSFPIGSTQNETEYLNFECRLQRSINRQSNPAIKTWHDLYIIHLSPSILDAFYYSY